MTMFRRTRTRCLTRSGFRIASIIVLVSFRAARNNASRSRALIRGPKLLLCDEPTGNLDRHTATQVADLLLEINRASKTILVVVTHSTELAAQFPATYELLEGKLVKR